MSNIKFEIKGYLEEEKCESVDKKTFKKEIKNLKWEIERHNNFIDEHYKKINKI